MFAGVGPATAPPTDRPSSSNLRGTRQLVTFTHQYLVGLSVARGELLWRRPFKTPSDTTSQTPILFRDTIIQNGRSNGVTAFRVVRRDDAWTTEDIWQTQEVSLYMTNGVVIDDVLYGLSHLNGGQYFALDLSTGKVLWKSEPRQAENAAMVRAGDTIFSLEDDGEMVVMKASRDSDERGATVSGCRERDVGTASHLRRSRVCQGCLEPDALDAGLSGSR